MVVVVVVVVVVIVGIVVNFVEDATALTAALAHARLVQGQAAAVLQHCLQQFITLGDLTSSATLMKLTQVFSAHASCCPIVLAFALSSISSAFQQTSIASQTCR